ncbi:MAG: glycosyltransferase family 2 protein [Candidatus Geothermincolia bacterium]
MSRLAAAVINYNTREDLRACLKSLENAGADELVVVDNGSTDGSQAMVAAEFPSVKLIQSPDNRGYSAACNLGIEGTTAPYILILNSDTEFPVGRLDRLADYLDRHEKVAALGPKILNTDGSVQMSCRRFPSLTESLAHGLLGEIWPRNPMTRAYHMKDFDHSKGCEVDWVSGCAVALRRTAMEQVGGFDEGYFMYVEDVDLCKRLWDAGWEVAYCPDVPVLHHIGRTSRMQSARMLREHHLSMYRFFRKNESCPADVLLRPLILAGLALRYALTRAHNRYRQRAFERAKKS